MAAEDVWKRIEAISRLHEFQQRYREQWQRRKDGEPDVEFPAGTYQLRVFHGVRCATA